MNQTNKDALAEALVQLIHENSEVRGAIVRAALSCPNVVREV